MLAHLPRLRYAAPRARWFGRRGFQSIPVIDISSLTDNGPPAEQARVAKELHDACRDVGFFYVSGHGMDEAVRTSVLDYGRRFFEQPQAFKDEISIAKSTTFRGYQKCGLNITQVR
jgi:isopenicillin N synthase-like dioxygenase